jgi:membrane protein implicated in regulation of membrane protease activity
MGAVTIIYLASLVTGFLLALVTVLAGDIFGGDHDIGVDHDLGGGVDAGHDVAMDVGHAELGAGASVSPMSLPVVASFLTFFGGTGLVADQGMKTPAIMSVPLAGLVGVGVAALAFFGLAKLFLTTQGTAHGRIAEMVGLDGEVITPIPAEGVGEIAFDFKGSRRNQSARSESGEEIKKHAMVKITRVVGNTCYVRPLVEERLRDLKESPEAEASNS